MTSVRDRPDGVVLIVNDAIEVNEGLRQLLESDGHRVAVALNGQGALPSINAGLHPCLILLDLIMPVMNGFDFRAVQLARNDVKNVPVVVMSAFTLVDHPGARERLQATDYVRLPQDVNRIPAIVRRHCSASRMVA